MKGYRITLNLEEFVEDSFKHIKGQIEACKKEELIETIEDLTNTLKNFIKSHNL